MSVAVTMNQVSQTPPRFVDNSTTYHLDASGPDPELKKILPLVFATLDTQIKEEIIDDSEIFAPLFVDKSQGVVKRSVSSQKVLPVLSDDFKGISTYFSGFHPGIDYRAPLGTAIHAILPGIVNQVGYERGGYGRFVILLHYVDGKTLFSLYAHMYKTVVKAGETVDSGQIIGQVGLTGHTTGPHLHFELHDTTRALNPLKFFAANNLAMVAK